MAILKHQRDYCDPEERLIPLQLKERYCEPAEGLSGSGPEGLSGPGMLSGPERLSGPAEGLSGPARMLLRKMHGDSLMLAV